MIKSIANNYVLGQPWGGLGDNLQYSNLPSLYSTKGDNFSVSVLNHERNKNIYNFCWKNNPDTLGKVFKKPNIGWNIWIKNLEKYKDRKDINIIQKNNLIHGFSEGDGFPTIQLNKKYINLENEFEYISDFNSITLVPSEKGWKKIFKEIGNTHLKNLSFPHVKDLTSSPKKFDEKDNLICSSFDDLISILSKTKYFICLNSGSHIIAASLKKYIGKPDNIICYIPGAKDVDHPEGRFMFDNVEYKKIEGYHRGPENDKKQRRYEKFYLKYLNK
tara:strand:- start:3389 stop:4210 length:822 start_codon:yes stop_codon:yes gene_type:complete